MVFSASSPMSPVLLLRCLFAVLSMVTVRISKSVVEWQQDKHPPFTSLAVAIASPVPTPKFETGRRASKPLTLPRDWSL